MIMREKLLEEMSSWAAQSRWKQTLQELTTQLLEARPPCPYIYLQRKTSLRQKLDNSRTSQYLIELTMFLTQIDPLVTLEQTIKDKIISLCVEKYQHTKIKKTEIQQFVSVVLLPLETAQKEQFIKLLDQILDREIYTILEHANVLYQTVLFRAAIEELTRLEKLLELAKVNLDKNLFTQYLNTSSEQNSILKQLGLDLDQEGTIHRTIAVQIAENISP